MNDSLELADELGTLLRAAGPALEGVTVNLIPYNAAPGAAGSGGYCAPTPEVATAFQRRVREVHGFRCTVRREMGQDIAGACGQLASLADATAPSGRVADIEDG